MSQIGFSDATNALIEDKESGYVLFLKVQEELSDHQYYNFEVKSLDTGNAGFDLISAENWNTDKPYLLSLGVSAMLVDIVTRLPVHYWLLPRSSIYKTGYSMANSVGVIDSTYRGVLMAPVVKTGSPGTGFTAGNRYFQIVAPNMGPIHAVVTTSLLPDTERGTGGFGSTGQ